MLLLSGLFRSKRAIEITLAFIAAVLEVLHKGQTQRVNEGTQCRHREVQQVTDDQDQYEWQLLPCSTFGRAAHNHQSEVIERAAQHTAG